MFRLSSASVRFPLFKPPSPPYCQRTLHCSRQRYAKAARLAAHEPKATGTPKKTNRQKHKDAADESAGLESSGRARRTQQTATLDRATTGTIQNSEEPPEARKRTPETYGTNERRARTHNVYKTHEAKSRRESIEKYLQEGFGGPKRKAPKGDQKRINVVQEKLCDDVLELLKPSLTKHIGCDIIDINPGVGLWSSKLHDALKPRTHILMEPDDKIYQYLLQPLLDAEDSTYKFVPKSGMIWANLEKMLSKDYLPLQEELQRGDPRLELPNNTLLVTLNLGYFPSKVYRGFASLAALLIYQLLSSVRSHSLFHKYGLVRMLIWAADNEKRVLLPKTVAHRRKASIEAQISCEKIAEVASSTNETGRTRRNISLDFQRNIEVLDKMEEAGLKIPKSRESNLSEEFSKQKTGLDDSDKITTSRDFYEELSDLEVAFEAGEFTKWREHEPHHLRKRYSAEYQRMKDLKYRKQATVRKGNTMAELLSEHDAIMEVQRELYKGGKVNSSPEREELDERMQNWKATVEDMGPQEHNEFIHQLDNHLAFSTDPPLLSYDQREYEPLKVYKNEFFPQNKMCLLDLQPASMWPVLRENYPANYDVFEYILSSLWMLPTQSLKKGLTALWPGAIDWLLAECPSLTDPTRGGNLDTDMLRVRCLTLEMYKEMVEAWVRWPFRPSRYELMTRIGSTTHDADEEPGEMS